MVASEKFFATSDGVQIFVRTWEPEAGVAVRATVHIQHGLCEHSGRYAGLAEKLVGEGFAVVAHDSRGHGMSAEVDGSPGLGCIPCGPEGAVPRMVADLAELIAESQTARSNAPVILVGHSFGTVIARHCICGTAAPPPKLAGVLLSAPPARIIAPLALPFKVLLGALHMMHGQYGMSTIPAKLSFDKFQSQCVAAVGHTGPQTGFEWLNRDAAEVRKYFEDPHCGHDLAMGFWRSAVHALLSLKSPQTYEALSGNLPICVMAGEKDFCTIDDLGVASYSRVQQELASAGKPTPKVVVYPEARHALFKETNSEEVYQDALGFFTSCLAPSTPSSRL